MLIEFEFPIVPEVIFLNIDNYSMSNEYPHLEGDVRLGEFKRMNLPFSPPVSFDRQRLVSISNRSIKLFNSIFESIVRTTRRKLSIVNGIC